MIRSLFAGPRLDVTLMTVVLFSYIWIWQWIVPGGFVVCVGLCFAIGAWSHLTRNETAAKIGIRGDNLGACLRIGLKFIIPMAVVAVALGGWLGTIEPLRPRTASDLSLGIARSWLWGTLQQYVLACFYYRRLLDLLGSHRRAAVAAAGVFALAHLPNPFLVPVCFVAGIVACQIYRRAPNVFALGLLHFLLSISLRQSFGPEITHRMKVGPGYWDL